MTDEELRQLIASNAKAIAALTDESQRQIDLISSNARSIQAFTDESIRQSARLYEAMSRMAAAQSHFWQIQEDYYRRLDALDQQQRRTVDILNRLEKKLGSD